MKRKYEMKSQKNHELKQFMKNHEAELGEVTKNLEKAEAEYKKAMKKFVINHITTKAQFKKRFNESLEETIDLISGDPIWVVIGDSKVDVLVYENMVDNQIWWLEEGQFDDA